MNYEIDNELEMKLRAIKAHHNTERRNMLSRGLRNGYLSSVEYDLGHLELRLMEKGLL
tara:strand:+ start:368 stop:541 length:174 start_codon:yes stop_codon:yes gene_type:complete